jgi:hypothetical protein
MRGLSSTLALLLLAVAACPADEAKSQPAPAAPLAARSVDLARVKRVVARFLGMAPSRINWLRISKGADAGLVPPLVSVEVPDPPDSRSDGAREGISIDVSLRGLYVESAMWRRNQPPDRPKCPDLLSLDKTQAMAARLAWHALVPWPPGMRMTRRAADYRGQENPTHDFQWEQWDGIARTGTRISIAVNPCPPGRIYILTMYVAPRHSVAEVKVTKEQAIAAAIDSLSKRGAKNPRVWQGEADLYLSDQWLSRPHWLIELDYDNRQGGPIQSMLIDAVTGKEAKPEW